MRTRSHSVARTARKRQKGTMRLILRASIYLMLLCAPAMAGSSDWYETTGGAVRLVSAEQPKDGELRAALEIRLQDGWKTYWRAPGEGGIPPQITVAPASRNVEEASLRFPAPERFGAAGVHWAGYQGSVTLPVVFKVADEEAATRIVADVFLGICESICVPVQAELRLVPEEDAGPLDGGIVDLAFASLPRAADAGFGVRAAVRDGDRLVLEVAAPESGNVELFLAAEGVMLAPPSPLQGAGIRFATRILGKTALEEVTALDYTLVAGGRAVSGTIAVEDAR